MRKQITQLQHDEAIRKAEARGRESALRDLEAVIAGDEPKVLTMTDVAGMSEAEINSRWSEVSALLAHRQPETNAGETP